MNLLAATDTEVASAAGHFITNIDRVLVVRIVSKHSC